MHGTNVKFIYLFICGLFNDADSSPGYKASNDRVLGMNCEHDAGIRGDPIYGTIAASACKEREKPRNPPISQKHHLLCQSARSYTIVIIFDSPSP